MKNKFNIYLGAALLFCATTLNVSAQTLTDAINLTNSERYDDAEIMFNQLTTSGSVDAKTCFYAGENIMLRHLSDPASNPKQESADAASAYFKKGASLDATDVLNSIGQGMVVFLIENDTVKGDALIAKALVTIPKKIKVIVEKDETILTKAALAELYLAKPRYEKAVALLIKAQGTKPSSPTPFIALGDVYLSWGKYSEAIQAYNRANYIDKNNLIAKVKIGNLYLKSKNLTEARSIFENVISIDPNFAPAYKGLGEMYSMTGASGAVYAKQNYKKFLELSGNNLPARISYVNSLFKAKDYTEVLNLIDQLIIDAPTKNYLNRLGGYSAFEKREYEKAKAYMEVFFANATPDKTIQSDYVYYGKALIKLKSDTANVNKGFEQLQKALSYDETNDEIISEIATSAYYARKYDLSIEMVNKKVTNGTVKGGDLFMQGKSYYQIKQYGKADTAFTKVVENEPMFVPAYVMIANTYSAMDPDSKLGLAKPKFEIVVEKASVDTVKFANDLFDAYSYLGAYYLFSDNPDYVQAEYYFNKILALNPQNKKWVLKGYNSLGTVAIRKKDYATAKKYFTKVYEMEPTEDTKKTLDAINKSLNYKPQK